MMKRNNTWIPYSRLSHRKQRDTFIRLRQKIRNKATVYDGPFTSHDVLDEPDRPSIFNQWADFYFLGSDGLTIWNATIVSAVLEFWNTCEEMAHERTWEKLTPEEQSAEVDMKFELVVHKGKRMYRLLLKPETVYDKFQGLAYSDYQNKLTEEIIKNEAPRVFESFSTDISFRYGIGLKAVIHAEEINRATIEAAIHRFRTIGETDWRSAEPVPRTELPYKSATMATKDEHGRTQKGPSSPCLSRYFQENRLGMNTRGVAFFPYFCLFQLTRAPQLFGAKIHALTDVNRASGLTTIDYRAHSEHTVWKKLTVLHNPNSVVTPIKELLVPQKKIANATKKKHTV